MTIYIHPAYDTGTGTWFVEGRKEEAPTIRQLIEAIKRNSKTAVKVVGYHPNGISVVRSSSSPSVKTALVTATVHKLKPGKIPPNVIEEILDLWAAGVSGVAIARKFNLKPATVSAHLIPTARAKGDPRAVVRNSKSYGQRKGPWW